MTAGEPLHIATELDHRSRRQLELAIRPPSKFAHRTIVEDVPGAVAIGVQQARA